MILGCFKGAFLGVGVLGRIGVCTDESGQRAVVLAVVVLVDACTSLVFVAAGVFPHVPPLPPTRQVASLVGDDGGNCGGGAFPGDKSVVLFASLLVGMGEWPTRLWVCGVLGSLSSSMIRRRSIHCSHPQNSSSSSSPPLSVGGGYPLLDSSPVEGVPPFILPPLPPLALFQSSPC